MPPPLRPRRRPCVLRGSTHRRRVGPARPCSLPGSSLLVRLSSSPAPEGRQDHEGDSVRRVRPHQLEGYPGSILRSTRTPGDPQTAFHDGWTLRKRSNSRSAPRTPRPTVPSGTGVHEGANLTQNPASHRSNAKAWRVAAGAEPGGVTRATLVSRMASESAAVIVRERKTDSRAEPRSSSERARISPRISRPPFAGSSISTTEHRAVSGRVGSVGAGTASSSLSQESVAENSIRPAVLVATIPAGSGVGSTAATRLSTLRGPRIPPAPFSGPPFPLALALPPAGRPWVPGLRRRRPQSRRTADGASRDDS